MRKLTCYAWGKPGDWEALCVDLDIATQGKAWSMSARTSNWQWRIFWTMLPSCLKPTGNFC